MSLWRRISFLAGPVLSLLFLSSSSFAQLSTASINGVVRDSSGAVIPKANVVLRNVDTAVENTSVSNNSGAYVFLSITPGRYTLHATASGFGAAEVPAFTLTVSQVAAIDFVLKLGPWRRR